MIEQPSINRVHQQSSILVTWTLVGGPPFLLAVAGVALITDVMILGAAGLFVAAASIAAVYALSIVGILVYSTRTSIGPAEWLALMLSLAVIAGAIIGVRGGLQFSAILALGYLFAIFAGYSIFRLGRSELAKEATVRSEEVAHVEPISFKEDLRRVDIFRDLTDEQLALVMKLATTEERRAGEFIGVQGRQGDALYIVLDGQVELTTSSSVGQLTVRVAGRGESLPLAVLLGGGDLITSAVALSEVRALVIPRDRLLSLCAERPDIGMKLFQSAAAILAERYRSMLNRLGVTVEQALERSGLRANINT